MHCALIVPNPVIEPCGEWEGVIMVSYTIIICLSPSPSISRTPSTMKETPPRRLIVTSSWNKISTDQMGKGWGCCLSWPRRLLRGSRPQEICQPPPRGFFCVRTCPVAASRKYFSAIQTSPHLNSHHTWSKNNIIFHYYWCSVLLSMFGIKINVSYVLWTVFTIWHKFRPLRVSVSVT